MSTPPVHTVRNTLALLVPITAILAGCSDEKAPQALKIETSSEPAVTEPKHDWFTDAASESGLDFIHLAGLTGEHYYVEIVPPGCALFDYDNDGDLDVYIVQGTPLEPDASISDAWTDTDLPADFTPTNRLYRNDLITDGTNTGELHFTDITDQSGAGLASYGMGVTAADFNNDGFTDLFVTNFGPDALLLNNGDGTFTDATAASGLDDPRWTTAATAIDYDRDGDLDLFVGQGGDFTIENAPVCFRKPGIRDYCAPAALAPVADKLYRNNGNAVFTDVSELLSPITKGHALGVVAADFDNNGWPDLYVANDGDANHLWLNDHGKFVESALLKSAAYNEMGQAEAGMGIAIGDYDDDGDEDLFLTHLRGETNTDRKSVV